MNEETESIIQGETFRIGVTVRLDADDGGLVDADLVVYDEDKHIVITKSGSFVESPTVPMEFEADLSTSDTDITPGTYEYFIRINWDDGSNDIVPDTECVESGSCEYSELIICEKPEAMIVS